MTRGRTYGEPSARVRTSPVVQLSGNILEEAIRRQASDVHIEPGPKDLLIRFRIDGLLQDHLCLSMDAHGSLVSRLKILGKMDIAERRLPQDGAVQVRMPDRTVDLRSSTIPTVYGEKMVLRVLDQGRAEISLNALGMRTKNLEDLRSLIGVRKGIILVTGPTGSGKTTTLYALLRELRSKGVNLVSVEDPVEYRIDGINQVQVNSEIGLTFAECLRSILRQDPNIILIGEIRDIETAEIAFRAAMTGHLVLSTLHTNDSISTITRLIDLGVPRYLVGSLLVGAVAQRLVRRICRRCGPDHSMPAENGDKCPSCLGSGFSGRVGIHEILTMSSRVKEQVLRTATPVEIRSAALSSGFITLAQDGAEKVREGLTTMEEVWREVDVREEGIVSCPGCARSVSEEFLACPHCGETISSTCGHCSKIIQPDWSFCPFCRHPKT